MKKSLFENREKSYRLQPTFIMQFKKYSPLRCRRFIRCCSVSDRHVLGVVFLRDGSRHVQVVRKDKLRRMR